MNANFKEKKITSLKRKGLVLAISAIITSMVSMSVTQASDVQIYQNPSATNYPIIMLAIDTSPSMDINDATYKGVTRTRIAALKLSLVDALQAKNVDGSYKIPDITYMGISRFDTKRGKIWIAAKRLDVTTSGKTHRQTLIDTLNGLTAGSSDSTPTPTIFAETYAYLLGSTTESPNNISNFNNGYQNDLRGMSLAVAGTVSGTGTSKRYIAPIESLPTENDKQCSTQGIFFLTDGAPTGIPASDSQTMIKNVMANANIGGKNADNVTCQDVDVPSVFYNYSNARGTATSNGEFFEMKLTPSISEITTNNTVNGYQDRSGWSCIANMVRASANTTKTSKKRIYLSTVGYGPLFSKAAGEQCITNPEGRNIHCWLPNDKKNGTGNTSPYSNTLNADALKMLGDKVGQGDTYGTSNPIGGYVFADTGEKVTDALIRFAGQVGQGSFESASFGTYVVPADPFATSSSYNYVFAPQFQPKISGSSEAVQSTQQLWAGNLKKYALNSSGTLVDSNGRALLNTKGLVNANTKDFWNATNLNDGDSTLKGGMGSQLTIPNAGTVALNTVTDAANIKTRPLWINATIPTNGTDKNKIVAATSLTKLTTAKVFDASFIDSTVTTSASTRWRKNLYQPYLLSALGYKLTATELATSNDNYKWDTVDKVKNLNVMQQMGGIIHSDPLLITLEGKYDPLTGAILANTTAESNNRKDYIVAGTMQGLLHMVDQKTGEEAFAFLPNEILQDTNRRDALLDVSNTQNTTINPYYGVDAPWASWVEYKLGTGDKFVASTANIYGGMRMGGSSYYGLDVKDPTSPKFLFQIDPVSGTIKSSTSSANTTTANAAIQAMGQSWSKPTLANIRFNNQIRKVMIVGGGYDSAYETPNYVPQTSLGSITESRVTGPVVQVSTPDVFLSGPIEQELGNVSEEISALDHFFGSDSSNTTSPITTQDTEVSEPISRSETSINGNTTTKIEVTETVETKTEILTSIKTEIIYRKEGGIFNRKYYKNTKTTKIETKKITKTKTTSTITTVTKNVPSQSNKGAGVYIFDATTGALLWNVRAGINNNDVTTTDVKDTNLKYSVVSQIKSFDRDADGLVDNLYFGDLGGQIFRVDLNNAYDTATTNFGRINRLADFSSLNQRFYEMPSLSIHENNGKRFGVISIASGNRSFPLNVSNGADNRIYALYDYDIASSNLFNSTFTKTSDLTEASLLNWADIAKANVTQLTGNTKKGWYYTLRKTGTADEAVNTGTVKALNGYLVVANTAKFSDLYVSLYNPNHNSSQQPNACTGGITGSSVVKRLCLPYGVCADDLTVDSNFTSSSRESNSDAKDGISKVQAGGFNNGTNNLITLLPNVGRNYKTTKVFQSSNWYER